MKKVMKENFELCRVCKLNHNQGRRHNYIPNHVKSLSAFLKRFKFKLEGVRFFLKNPTPLPPQHASLNRIWCVFCDLDLQELHSFVSCGNAIKHLASSEHLKTLKHFLWKYGGDMDCVDHFRVSEEDLAKWERKCKSLKVEPTSHSDESFQHFCGPVNDIHNKHNCGNIDIFDKNVDYSRKSSISNDVLPLPYNTNEIYQISQSEPSGFSNSGSILHNITSSVVTCSDTNLWGSNDLTGLHAFTRISSVVQDVKGNVHSGGPVPWFNATEETQFHAASSKAGKFQKLNPNRVGAVWAEKRKIEMEMEKSGEIVENNFGGDWLPNFGRVWQAGTRKQSRKEFEVEKHMLPKSEVQAEMQIKIQPYISKRMGKRDGE